MDVESKKLDLVPPLTSGERKEDMASLLELSVNYSPAYAFWCFVEFHTDFWGKTSWLNKIAMLKMNAISQKLKGKDVFAYKGKV